LVLRVGQALGLVLEPGLVLEQEPVPEPEPEPEPGSGLVRHSQQQSIRSAELTLPPELISFSFLSIYLLKY
jgi:hypothetical protein